MKGERIRRLARRLPLLWGLVLLLEALASAQRYWLEEAEDSGRKPHLRAGVVQSFEFSYELAIRSLRRVLIERAAVAVQIAEASAAFLPEAHALLQRLEAELAP